MALFYVYRRGPSPRPARSIETVILAGLQQQHVAAGYRIKVLYRHRLYSAVLSGGGPFGWSAGVADYNDHITYKHSFMTFVSPSTYGADGATSYFITDWGSSG